jgi:hypothetical protein
VHNILPSTFSTASASARLNFSRLNIPLHMIAVYASRPSSPAAPQHSLEGGSLLPYPRRTFTGWKAPASPGALRSLFCSTRYCGAESTPMTIQIRVPRPDASRSRGSRRLHRAILSGIVQSVPQPQPATLAISNRLNGKVPVTSAKR